MLYQAYQTHCDLMAPVRALAQAAAAAPLPPTLAAHPLLRTIQASWEVFAGAALTHERPSFGIDTVVDTLLEGPAAGARGPALVREEPVVETPFGSLVRFVVAGRPARRRQQPAKVLLVAPLSGHFATLLRGTVRTLLPGHDVHLTDWRNARDVPVEAGRFGFDEYVEHLIAYLAAMGPGAHVIAVCQPCPAALAAVALMAQDAHPATPRTLTLMAGPVDARVNPTRVNELAESRSLAWFERNLVTRVPARYPGAGRRVYPGFLQLSAFVGMNPLRHWSAHRGLVAALAAGDDASAAATRSFYEEYFAVLDLTAEFYLDTVQRVFQEHHLATGRLQVHGRTVDPGAITTTALLTVEGENDDICAPGQTVAAHELCRGLPLARKRHHLQPAVGHYGVFSGRRWEQQIYPVIANTILANR